MYTVNLARLAKEFSLEVLTPQVNAEQIEITRWEVNRPALQLAGYFAHFDSDRIQIIGKVEHTYLNTLDPDLRKDMLWQIFQYKVPCVVMCKGLEVFPEMLEFANEFGVPVFRTGLRTSNFMAEVIWYLQQELAERTTLHGVLVDVYGEGLLIMGESGIGKSETALELLKRGHRLVADDAVIVKKVSHRALIGYAPTLLQDLLELRGIGIINVRELYGVGVIKREKVIDMVIQLETWNGEAEYDRLGLSDEYMDILGNKVLCKSVPIRPGRNLAMICESAAINHRQKKLSGRDAAQELQERLKNQKGRE